MTSTRSPMHLSMTAKGCTRKEVAILFIDNNNNLKGNLLAGLKLVEVQSQDMSFTVVLIVKQNAKTQRRKTILTSPRAPAAAAESSCDHRCHHHQPRTKTGPVYPDKDKKRPCYTDCRKTVDVNDQIQTSLRLLFEFVFYFDERTCHGTMQIMGEK